MQRSTCLLLTVPIMPVCVWETLAVVVLGTDAGDHERVAARDSGPSMGKSGKPGQLVSLRGVRSRGLDNTQNKLIK